MSQANRSAFSANRPLTAPSTDRAFDTFIELGSTAGSDPRWSTIRIERVEHGVPKEAQAATRTRYLLNMELPTDFAARLVKAITRRDGNRTISQPEAAQALKDLRAHPSWTGTQRICEVYELLSGLRAGLTTVTINSLNEAGDASTYTVDYGDPSYFTPREPRTTPTPSDTETFNTPAGLAWLD